MLLWSDHPGKKYLTGRTNYRTPGIFRLEQKYVMVFVAAEVGAMLDKISYHWWKIRSVKDCQYTVTVPYAVKIRHFLGALSSVVTRYLRSQSNPYS